MYACAIYFRNFYNCEITQFKFDCAILQTSDAFYIYNHKNSNQIYKLTAVKNIYVSNYTTAKNILIVTTHFTTVKHILTLYS